MQLLRPLRLRAPGYGATAWMLMLLGVLLGASSAPAAQADVLLAQAEDEATDVAEPPASPSEPSPSESPPSEPEPEAAAAESSLAPPSGVEVMHVRGRGVAAIDTEVPDSVTQFDASTIQALGAQDISDLSRVTPNVNIVQPGATQSTFFIRGVGLSDFSSNAAGAVTIFQDDVSLNAPAIQTGQLFDVEGVEIVRGPQGTGPFRNASAGAIRVRSRRPTGNYNAILRSSLGRYDADSDGANDALIQDYEGAFETPIVEDALSTRFAFRLRDAGGLMTNGCGNALPFSQRLPRANPRLGETYPVTDPRVSQCGERGPEMLPPFNERRVSQIPEGLPEEVSDQHSWASRGTLRFQPPGSELDFFLNAHGSRLDQDAPLGQAVGTASTTGAVDIFGGATGSGYREPDTIAEFESLCDRDPDNIGLCRNPNAAAEFSKLIAERPLDVRPYRGDYNRVGQETRDTWGGFLSGQGKLGDMDLSALASYDAYRRFRDQDTDFTPDLLFQQIEGDEAWQTYEELRLAGELEVEPFAWELGGFYLHEELDVLSDTTISNRTLFNRKYAQTIDSFGVWGEFEWDFVDDFTLGGGVRFNWERKGFRFRRDSVQFGIPRPRAFSRQEVTWQTPTGEIILTYHWNDEISTYGKYSRGFKAGHFNALASENIDRPPADEEYNDAWEAGLKASWLDRRLSATTAFFYYRYENYQVFLFRDTPSEPPVLEIINAKQAENYGIEVEGRVTPLVGWAPNWLEGLVLSGNFGWLHGEYLDFNNIVNRRLQGQVVPIVVDFSGKQLQNAPEYKVSLTAEWTFDFGRFGYLIPRYDGNWSDDVFFDTTEGRGSVRTTGEPNLVEFAVGQPAFFLHNVRLAYRTPTGNVEVAAWMRNIEDQVYKNFAFDASNFSGVVINFVGEPRTIGVDVTFTF